MKIKMGVGATSEFATVKRFCGGSGKTECCVKEEVFFFDFSEGSDSLSSKV